MIYKMILVIALSIAITGCRQHQHDVTESEHEHEHPKFQYTAYSTEFEVFAEADPFIAGKSSNVLSHFSHVPGFKAVEQGTITIILSVEGTEVKQTLNEPTRKGIYSFDISPVKAGSGTLTYEILNESGRFTLEVPGVTVYAAEKEANEAAGAVEVSKANTTVFTKEQSWKIDFATELPSQNLVGQVVKTTAQVSPAQGSEAIVAARISGVVILNEELPHGKEVKAGEKLFTISGSVMADNNLSVRFSEAKSEYEKTKTDYERALELSKDKIVSERELAEYRNRYENAKAVYDNLNDNFSKSGQSVASPLNGFITNLYVTNGSFVEAGAPVLAIAQNKSLTLYAEIPLKYANQFSGKTDATIKDLNGTVYTLEQLNGRILSIGKAASENNYLLPVTIRIDNNGAFIPGSFVELFLKINKGVPSLTVPSGSLIEEQGNFFVWVQITPELFEKREVTIGTTDGINTEILSGLRQNERIITTGAMLVKLAQSTGTLDAHSGHVH